MRTLIDNRQVPSAVVFAFAIADGLSPVVGAAPFDVLARQLPRLLVARLNGSGDRGIRFFPFLGPVDGQRSFLRLREPLAPKLLLGLHRQGDVELLADACLQQDRLQWRVLDGRSGSVKQTVEMPFDPLRPLDVLPRMEFEIISTLGWSGHCDDETDLEGSELGWFLVLKDDLLRREAGLPDAAPDSLRSARRCVEFAAGNVPVQQLVMDFLALLLRRGQQQDGIASVAIALGSAVHDPDMLDRLGGLTLAAGDEHAATAMVVRAALLVPERADFVERAAAMAFRAGDDDVVRRVVAAARAVSAGTPAMLAQLAASCDRCGDYETRSALLRELTELDDLSVPVARLVVSFLLDDDQAAQARIIVERALAKSPDQAMLHFELGRACLLLGDSSRAGVALQRALDLDLKPALIGQARRWLRLSSVPGLWAGSELVEKLITTGDLGEALAAARALVRHVGSVAEAWLVLGIVWHKLGRLRRAERFLRRAIGCHADCVEAHNRLGILLLQSGRVEAGSEHLERARSLAPDDTSILLHLAQARALCQQHAEAEQFVDRAEQLGADPQLVRAVRREIAPTRD